MKYILALSMFVLLLNATNLFGQDEGMPAYWAHIQECKKIINLKDTIFLTHDNIICFFRDTNEVNTFKVDNNKLNEFKILYFLAKSHYAWISKNDDDALILLEIARNEYTKNSTCRLKKKYKKNYNISKNSFKEYKKLFELPKVYIKAPDPLASAELINAMPRFESPLTPTSRYDCSIFFSECPTLDCVDYKMSNIFSDLGYNEKSYFQINNGYVITLRLERTDENGIYLCEGGLEQAKCDCRFKYDNIVFDRHMKNNSFTLETVSNYIDALFFGRMAYFRLFVFVITSDYLPTNKSITQREAISWIESGSLTLPIELKNKRYTTGYSVNCWVYEYKANDSDKILHFISNSGKSAYYHLEKSGILEGLKK